MGKQKIMVKVLAIDMLMICVSFSISIIGQMFDAIKDFYDLTLSQGGLLLSVQSVGGFIVGIALILFIDAFEKKKTLVLSGIMLCVFLICVGIKMPLPVLFFVFIMLGFFTGMVNTLTNAVMADTVQIRQEKYIIFMHMLFSLGAVIGPIISFALYTRVGLSGVFYVIGGIMLVWSIFAAVSFKENLGQKLIQDKMNIKYRLQQMVSVFKRPGMKEIAVIAFLVCAWQQTVTYYISSVFSAASGLDADGARALSVFFLGMMVSRLLYAKSANKYSQGLVLVFGCILGFGAWMVSMSATDMIVKTVLLGVSALFCGNNLPICFTVACKISPNNTATATGIVIFAYFLSVFILLPVVGTLGESIGLGTALAATGISLLLLLPFALVLHKKMKAPKPHLT